MHEAGIVHRDLHGGNILIHKNKNSELTAYISDFGCATVINGDKNNVIQNRALFSPAKQSKIYNLEKEYKETASKIKEPGSKDVEKLKARNAEILNEISKIGGDPSEDSFAFGVEICRLAKFFRPEGAKNNHTWLNLKADPLKAHEEVVNFVNRSFGDEESALKTLVLNLLRLDPSDRLGSQALIDELNAISDEEIAKIWPDEDNIENKNENQINDGEYESSYANDSMPENDYDGEYYKTDNS
ncbi:MAG: hypothetical protein H0T62_08865 [Parachlamydiaceae bacterium]|nr:hypothetical protein [Parachlamydiaceae bacterium]